MRICWGELEVRDAHIHFFSHGFFTLLARQKEGLRVEEMGPLLGWEMPPEEPEQLAARWVQELDRHGVAQAVLIASLPGDEDSVIAAVKAFPGRFYGYFFLNPLAQDALGRSERALEAGLRGICLFPAMHHFSLHDDRLRPVWELAAARGAVVFVHCGVLTVGVRKKLGLASPFDLRFSNPVDLHGIALRYPQVRFVIPHFGAGYFREALMVADLCPNVLLDTSSSNSWTRYQAPPLELRAVFERALEVAGPRRLLFGTDSSYYPRGWHRAIFDEQVEALEAIGVPAEDARSIFGENLARLLGETLS
jgi:predicted TIM-barrel fold metal-dependent hydrolase